MEVCSQKSQVVPLGVKPDLPVTAATIGRWLKDILRKVGVAHEFTGHSTRLASASITFERGVSIKGIANEDS